MSEPKRIQLRRTKGWRKPDGAIVVSRPTRWGNPFTVPGPWAGKHDGLVYTPTTGDIYVLTRADAVNAYRRWLDAHPDLIAQARDELAGHDLACWCPLDQPCHADVLLEIANAAEGDDTA